MANEFNASFAGNFEKDGIALGKDFSGTFNISGDYPISSAQLIGTGDETLILSGDIGTIGYVMAKNHAALVEVTTPAAPSIANQGTPASTTISYKIVAKQSDGSYSAASSAGTTATAAASLTITDFPRLTWVNQTAATGGYDIYRTAAAGTPSSTGLIGSVGAGVVTFDDTGLAGDSATAPATGIDNVILLGADGASYPNRLRGQGFMFVEFNGSAIHAKGNTASAKLEYLALPR